MLEIQNAGGPTSQVGLNSVELQSSTDGVNDTEDPGGPSVLTIVNAGISAPDNF